MKKKEPAVEVRVVGLRIFRFVEKKGHEHVFARRVSQPAPLKKL